VLIASGLSVLRSLRTRAPLGALSAAYPVGAYPFGPMDKAPEWTAPLDSFLTHVVP
jgi:hypothetical protein